MPVCYKQKQNPLKTCPRFIPQATEWAPDEDTKRSCQSKGKSEVQCLCQIGHNYGQTQFLFIQFIERDCLHLIND